MILIYLSTPRIPSGQARTWLMQIYGDLGKYLNSHSRGKSHFKRFIFARNSSLRQGPSGLLPPSMKMCKDSQYTKATINLRLTRRQNKERWRCECEGGYTLSLF
ncbi:hypothetical protein CDAR_177381 [Caerostris darwini]|uniref:Uncharacterized protein n=1 Tax=Caerostris darwini TaxID=1538125 RepID=A0AAV4P1J9_9ARAC|nr:hypothetical protein CDAR_177381 [Caerostris darwini]